MTEDLKRSLLTEIGNWKMAYGKAMNNKASLDMRNLLETIDDTQKKLSRPCKDLDDIRSHMNSLNQIKEKEIEIDRTITLIEETYAMLNKYEITFNDGNAEKVDSLAYGWKNLNEKEDTPIWSKATYEVVKIEDRPVAGTLYYLSNRPTIPILRSQILKS